jgi:hypothetical protein
MKVWRLTHDSNKYRDMILKNEKDLDRDLTMELHTAERLISSWSAPEFTVNPQRAKKPMGDFVPFLNGFFVVSTKAAQSFEKDLKNSIELLPIPTWDGYFIVHVIDICNAIDYNKSELKFFPDNPTKIMRIVKPVFKEEEIKDKLIFKDAGFPVTHVYVSNRGKEIIEGWKVKGALFIEQWDSEMH